jgi:hypothetical protein
LCAYRRRRDGRVRFDRATLRGDARFDGATLPENAWFDEATFAGAERVRWAPTVSSSANGLAI